MWSIDDDDDDDNDDDDDLVITKLCNWSSVKFSPLLVPDIISCLCGFGIFFIPPSFLAVDFRFKNHPTQ